VFSNFQSEFGVPAIYIEKVHIERQVLSLIPSNAGKAEENGPFFKIANKNSERGYCQPQYAN
jgi:hypothetical protein